MTNPDATGDGGPVLNLQALIRARMDERGWSYADVAHRTGDEVTRGRLQQLGNGTRMSKFPDPGTILLLAQALEVDVTAVVLAAAQSLGLDARRRGPDLAQLLPAGTDRLSKPMQTAILAIVRAAVAESLLVVDDDEVTGVLPAPTVTKPGGWPKTDAPTGRTGRNGVRRKGDTSS